MEILGIDAFLHRLRLDQEHDAVPERVRGFHRLLAEQHDRRVGGHRAALPGGLLIAAADAIRVEAAVGIRAIDQFV